MFGVTLPSSGILAEIYRRSSVFFIDNPKSFSMNLQTPYGNISWVCIFFFF